MEAALAALRKLTRTRPVVRALTPAEAAHARRVFADGLDLAPVRVTRGHPASTGAARTLGNTIHLRERDFAGAGPDLTPAGMELLVHELTHVWQYQTGGPGYFPASMLAQALATVRHGHRHAAYEWRPQQEAGVPFERWNPEQQAAAVEEYGRLLTRQGAGALGADSSYP